MSVTGQRLEPTIFERSSPGRGGGKIPHAPKDALARIPAEQRRSDPPALPEMNEPEVVRHYVNLSQLNYAVDTGFYPLGSCTMKWNPKLNEWAARLPGFAGLHPMAPDAVAQGTLQLLWELEAALVEISGMAAVSLQPAAGAQGELTGILMIRAYHRSRGEVERTEVLVPDSSHGTNPATATMAGFKTVTIPSAADGGVDLDAFRAALGPHTAAVMITNPSTLGLFETRIGELLEAVHAAGALAYMDGANLNAILGRFKPGEAGFDVMHFNVHKTFSTPHGGGGPGAGPVGRRCQARAVPARATGRARRRRDVPARAAGERPSSIGRMRSFVGNTGVLVRAYATSWPTAAPGLHEVSDDAVLAANYLEVRLAGTFDHPVRQPGLQARVRGLRGDLKKATGVRTLDIAKRLIDYGYHPPTIYFPLIVEEGMLIEPTETEPIETLDAFADALIAIAAEARRDARAGPRAPPTTPRPASRRGDGRPPAEPALATDGRRPRRPARTERRRACRMNLSSRPGVLSVRTRGRPKLRDSEEPATSEPNQDAERLRKRAEESALLERMQADDLDAFEAFFLRYRTPIYRTAYGLTGDPQAAEEILQDTFARAYQRRHILRPERLAAAVAPPGRPQPVLLEARPPSAALRAHGDDGHRAGARRRRRSRRSTRSSRSCAGSSATASPRLPPKHRSVVILYYLHGLSLQETAELLDVRLGTVKSRLHYALRGLRTRLEGDRRFGGAYGEVDAVALDSEEALP